jgi:hypothetical protein
VHRKQLLSPPRERKPGASGKSPPEDHGEPSK